MLPIQAISGTNSSADAGLFCKLKNLHVSHVEKFTTCQHSSSRARRLAYTFHCRFSDD